MKKLSSYVIACSVLLIACRSKAPEELEFKQYLENRFSLTLPDKRTSFLLVPSNQCINCFKNARFKFLGSDSIYLVTSARVTDMADNILIDSADELSKLKIADYSNTIITVEDERIVETKRHIDLQDYLDGVIKLW